MGKIVGMALTVAALWAAAEFYTKGTAGAFGGRFASESERAAPADERTVARRAGDSVQRAHGEAEARREALLDQ